MVKEILARKGGFVASISREHTVLEAAREMNARRIGALVITDGERVVGIFTERDVMTRVVALQLDPAKTKVEQVMTCPVACCTPETSLGECREVMTNRRIRHLPVVSDNKLAGIVTIGDVMAKEVVEHKEKIDDLHKSIDYLHEYMYGSYR
ncbi:MAG: CBS domain-containing protein [Phycisphaerae bacterium]|nr:CBS domain-containing protein [Phycisphaerae bacterium]